MSSSKATPWTPSTSCSAPTRKSKATTRWCCCATSALNLTASTTWRRSSARRTSPTCRTTASSASPSWRGSSRSEEHTSELQSLMRISYAVFCLKKKIQIKNSKLTASHAQDTQRLSTSLTTYTTSKSEAHTS